MLRFVAAIALLALSAPVAPPYKVSGSIPGPDGGWDYAQVDPATDTLFVARGDAVTAMDLAHRTVRSIGTIAKAHAVLPLPGGRLLVTSGNDASVRILDQASGAERARIAVGKKPDAAVLNADGSRAYVMNAKDGSVAEIDTMAMALVRTIAVRPGLESAVLVGNRLYANNEEANAIEVIDLAAGKTLAPIALPGCDGPTGLGLDAQHGRLISACANRKAAVVDLARRHLAGLVEIGSGPDAVIVDPARGLAFVPCGRDGTLDLLSLRQPGAVTRIARVKTEVGARTGALDPRTGTLYLPTARFAEPAPKTDRPVALPGSFHVLIVRPA